MPNRAAQIRAQVQAAYPGAVVEARGERWLRHRLPDGSTSLDVTVDRLHYEDDLEVDTDIVDATVPEADDQVTETPYEFYQRDGDRRLYPRRGVTTEYIDLGRPEFQRPNLTWAAVPWTGKSRDANVIAYSRSDARLEIVTGPERLKLNLVLLSLPTSTRWRFPASLVGLTRQGRTLIADSDGAAVAWMAAFTLVDAAGETRSVPDQLTGHPTYQAAYVIEPDLSGLVYPIVIDPTIDVAIAANANDAYWNAGGTFDATLALTAAGVASTQAHHSMLRFTGLTIPNAATINTAYLTLVAYSTQATSNCNVRISGVDEDNSAAATTAADANGRALTTANTTWNAVPTWTAGTAYQSPSIVSLVQEIVDRAGWASGNAMQIFIKDNGSTNEHYRHIAAIEHATYAAPELHILYGVVSFVATVTSASTASATVRSTPLLAPSVVGASTFSVSVSSTPYLSPSVVGAGTLSATLTSPAILTATVAGASTVSASVATTPRFTATVAGASSVTASVSSRPLLAPSVVGASTVTATVRSAALLTPTVAGVSTVTASLSSTPLFSASIVAASVVDCSLGGPALLVAAIVGASSVNSTLSSTALLSASVVSASTVTADVSSPGAVQIAATISGLSVSSISLTTTPRLTATITGTSTVSAVVSAPGVPLFTPTVVAASAVTVLLATPALIVVEISVAGTVTAVVTTQLPYIAVREPTGVRLVSDGVLQVLVVSSGKRQVRLEADGVRGVQVLENGKWHVVIGDDSRRLVEVVS